MRSDGPTSLLATFPGSGEGGGGYYKQVWSPSEIQEGASALRRWARGEGEMTTEAAITSSAVAHSTCVISLPFLSLLHRVSAVAVHAVSSVAVRVGRVVARARGRRTARRTTRRSRAPSSDPSEPEPPLLEGPGAGLVLVGTLLAPTLAGIATAADADGRARDARRFRALADRLTARRLAA